MSCASPTTVLRQAAAPIPETAQSPCGLLPQPRNRLSLYWTCFAPSEHFLYKMFPMSCPTKFRAGRAVWWTSYYRLYATREVENRNNGYRPVRAMSHYLLQALNPNSTQSLYHCFVSFRRVADGDRARELA